MRALNSDEPEDTAVAHRSIGYRAQKAVERPDSGESGYKMHNLSILAVGLSHPVFLQSLQSVCAGRIVGASGPDGVLIQLNSFRGGTAEHHRAKASIAQRQGLDPYLRGFVVPDIQISRRRDGGQT